MSVDGRDATRETVVREFVDSDAEAIGILLAELGYPADAVAVRARLARLAAAGDVVLVAQGRELLGVASLHVMQTLHQPGPVGRITALVVTHGARGLGVGRALVAEAERRLHAAGCAMAEVTSNRARAGAHAFYEHLGYEAGSLRFKKALERAADAGTTDVKDRA